MGLIHGCRKLVGLIPSLPSRLADSEAALTIVGIESETDEFPIGDQRALWAPEALIRKDRELATYVESIRESLLAACVELERLIMAAGLGLHPDRRDDPG